MKMLNTGTGAGGISCSCSCNCSVSSKLKVMQSRNELFGVETQRMTEVSLDGPENESSWDKRAEICLFKFSVRMQFLPAVLRVASRVETRTETRFKMDSVWSSISSDPEKSRSSRGPASSLLYCSQRPWSWELGGRYHCLLFSRFQPQGLNLQSC